MLRPHLKGFTLIEMTMTIVIIGVIGASIAVFMKPAIDTYFETNRRAIMTEGADVVVRRIERELKAALPNSIVSPAAGCVLFVPAVGGGRYRVDERDDGTGDLPVFNKKDASFDVLAHDGLSPAAGMQVVIYNTGLGETDVYGGSNRAAITSQSTTSWIRLDTSTKFPVPSPGNYFHLIANRLDVFACAGNQLYRFTLAGVPTAKPIACPAIPADAPVFAEGVSACSFVYRSGDGLVLFALGLTRDGETLMLQNEIHIDNIP
jgi:MSHA biogenesis protein MshO